MLTFNIQTAVFTNEKCPNRIQHARTASAHRRNGRSGHAEFGKRADAENEQRTEDYVQPVGDYKHAQRDRSVARPAKDAVEQEEKHDHDIRAQHDPHEWRAEFDHLRFGAK